MNILARINARLPRAGLIAACLGMLACAPAFAGPGFIASTRVSVDEADVDSIAAIKIRFNCKTNYLRHDPAGGGDRLRIYLEPTSICNGVSPVVAESRSRLRPFNSDSAHLVELEYDGDDSVGPVLILSFSKPVTFEVEMSGISFDATIRVGEAVALPAVPDSTSAVSSHRQVVREKPESPEYVVNLVSYQRIPTIADAAGFRPAAGQRLFWSEALVNGAIWYRLRLGNFESPGDASEALTGLKATFPGAWIDKLDPQPTDTDIVVAALRAFDLADASPTGAATDSKIDELMEDARRAMIAGDISRAIQIYTKVLQLPDSGRHAEAQEFLALAREKNGQMAHAKAEYQRYLSLYPDGDGAARVNQRLAALLANNRPASQPADSESPASGRRSSRLSDWRIQTYFSQYYRRDVNQPNDQDEIVSQSALYSDINFDARRRGARFDFSSRLSAGYRNDFLDNPSSISGGNSTRISYAYADLADAETGLRGRIGRQSRNSGGVLGRFDGINLGYELNEKILISTVMGKPAYSTTDGIDSSRSFFGASVNYGPLLENLDLGVYYIQQDIENIRDRQAVGGEFRYFGANQSLWGMVDYDLHFGELASAFLQGSWRFESRLSIHALANKRGSPFLSTGNAIIGQPVATFAELTNIFSAEELTQLGKDRTASSTNYTFGLSYPITPKLQISADAGQSTIDSTPDSGGVLGMPGSTYTYYSGSLLASSLVTEGDVSIFSFRWSDSDTSNVTSMTIDSRYPIGRSWRVNARLRVDRRQLVSDDSEQWLYTPGVRIQYRRSQKFRIEFEAGKLFSVQDAINSNQDRESYFVNVGYQVFF
jgi:hypothetical protein